MLLHHSSGRILRALVPLLLAAAVPCGAAAQAGTLAAGPVRDSEPATRPASAQAASVTPEAAPTPGSPALAPGATTGAPSSEAKSALPPSAGRPYSFFADLWAERREALAHADASSAALALAQIVAAKEAAGWPDIFVFGDALIEEAQAALNRRQPAAAVNLASAATAMAPHRPSGHLVLAEAQWAADKGMGPALQSLWRALMVVVGEPPLLRLHLGNLAVGVTTGLLVVIALFTLAALYRHGRSFAHDLGHLLPAGALPWQATLLAVVLLLAPVSLRLGPGWVVLVWLLLLSPYLERSERIMAMVVILMLGGLGAGLSQITSHWAYPGSRAQDAYLTAREASAEAAAARVAARTDPLLEELWALGLRARWEGNLGQARALLERAAAAGTDERLLLALGNVRYLAGDYPGAITAYEQALSRDGEYVDALFNLSRAYYAISEHQKAGAAHRRAMAADYERVERLSEEAKRAGPQYVVDATVPTRLLGVPLDLGRLHSETTRQVWALIAGKTPRIPFAMASGGAAVLLVLLGLVGGLARPSRICTRCGRPACRRCHPNMVDQLHCGQCFHAFVEKSGVDPQERIRSEIKAHRHRARRVRARQVLSVLLPGAGQMVSGASFRGFLLAACFFGAAVMLAGALGVVPFLPASEGAARVTVLALAGAVMLVSYLVALIDGIRRDG